PRPVVGLRLRKPIELPRAYIGLRLRPLRRLLRLGLLLRLANTYAPIGFLNRPLDSRLRALARVLADLRRVLVRFVDFRFLGLVLFRLDRRFFIGPPGLVARPYRARYASWAFFRLAFALLPLPSTAMYSSMSFARAFWRFLAFGVLAFLALPRCAAAECLHATFGEPQGVSGHGLPPRPTGEGFTNIPYAGMGFGTNPSRITPSARFLVLFIKMSP